MRKIFYRGSAIAGVIAGSLFAYSQSAGGAGGAAAGGVAGASAGAPSGVVTGNGGAASTVANPAGTTAPSTGQNANISAPGANIDTAGAAGINQPAASTPIGGSSIAGSTPNTVGGASILSQNRGAPAAAGTVGTLPATGTLPANRATQPPVQAGAINPIARAGSGATIADAQAGIPFSTLPSNLQQSVRTRLGNGEIQTISRDDLANGSVYRITALQNGVPTEMRFGANGAFLGSAALRGTATSFVTPGSAVVLDTLPAPVQETIRSQVGNGTLRGIAPQGSSYVVTYDSNGRPLTLLVAADGRIVRAGPPAVNATAAGAAPGTASGAGADTNAVPAKPQSSLDLEDLPDEVRATLGHEIANANVQSIRREKRIGGDVFIVGARDVKGDYAQLTLGSDGKIIQDSRDVPVIATGSLPRKDAVKAIPFSRVPVVVRDAVKAYAANADVQSVSLGTSEGQTIYNIVYMKDGRRDRMVLGKNGEVIRIDQNVSPALIDSGRPARLAVGDLPVVVRDTIRQQTDNVVIDNIQTKRVGDRWVYSVRYQTNGSPVELLVDSSGAVVYPAISPDAQAESPLPAPVARSQEETVKVVPASEITAPAVGNAGGPEVAAADSTQEEESAAGQAPVPKAVQQVRLSDVPAPVQKRAKELAGDTGVIASISPTLGDAGVVYEVKISKEGETKSFKLNKDGQHRQQ